MKSKSQSTIEYAILIAIVVAAVVGMDLYIRRSVQANLKMTETRINALDWRFEGAGSEPPERPPRPPRPPKPPKVP